MASNKKIATLICMTLITMAAVGCSDDSSSPTASVPVDTAPPAVPANFSASFDSASGDATLTWAANTTDSDLAGYVVTRDYYGEETALVASPAMITEYSVANPQMGLTTYYVYAVDTSGNESAVASAQVVRASQHQPADLNQ